MFSQVAETIGDSEELGMKKLFKEMTEEEKIAFANEVGRMYLNGDACLQAAAKNANEDLKGWPRITVYETGNVVETPICDALDLLFEASKQSIIQNLDFMTVIGNGERILKLAVHQALHDAFCLGMTAVEEMEMDFRGSEDFLSGGKNVSHIE